MEVFKPSWIGGGPSASFSSVDVSPGNERLIVGDADGNVTVWAVAPLLHPALEACAPLRAPLFIGHRHEGAINIVRWSPSGRWFASGSCDKCVLVWQLTSSSPLPHGTAASTEVWTPVATLKGHGSDITGVAWSPDETCLATTSIDSTLRVWRLQLPPAVPTGGSSLTTPPGAPAPLPPVAGVYKAPTILIKATCVATLTGHEAWALGVAWDPWNRLLASYGDDRNLIVWSARGADPGANMPGALGPSAAHGTGLLSPDYEGDDMVARATKGGGAGRSVSVGRKRGRTESPPRRAAASSASKGRTDASAHRRRSVAVSGERLQQQIEASGLLLLRGIGARLQPGDMVRRTAHPFKRLPRVLTTRCVDWAPDGSVLAAAATSAPAPFLDSSGSSSDASMRSGGASPHTGSEDARSSRSRSRSSCSSSSSSSSSTTKSDVDGLHVHTVSLLSRSNLGQVRASFFGHQAGVCATRFAPYILSRDSSASPHKQHTFTAFAAGSLDGALSVWVPPAVDAAGGARDRKRKSGSSTAAPPPPPPVVMIQNAFSSPIMDIAWGAATIQVPTAADGKPMTSATSAPCAAGCIPFVVAAAKEGTLLVCIFRDAVMGADADAGASSTTVLHQATPLLGRIASADAALAHVAQLYNVPTDALMQAATRHDAREPTDVVTFAASSTNASAPTVAPAGSGTTVVQAVASGAPAVRARAGKAALHDNDAPIAPAALFSDVRASDVLAWYFRRLAYTGESQLPALQLESWPALDAAQQARATVVVPPAVVVALVLPQLPTRISTISHAGSSDAVAAAQREERVKGGRRRIQPVTEALAPAAFAQEYEVITMSSAEADVSAAPTAVSPSPQPLGVVAAPDDAGAVSEARAPPAHPPAVAAANFLGADVVQEHPASSRSATLQELFGQSSTLRRLMELEGMAAPPTSVAPPAASIALPLAAQSAPTVRMSGDARMDEEKKEDACVAAAPTARPLLVTPPANASVVLLLTTSSSGTPSAHARASVVGALAPADSVPPSNNKLVRVAPYTWLSDKQAVRLAVARCILRAAYRMHHTRSRFGQQISFGGAGLGVDVDMQSSAASVSTLTGMLPQQLFGLVQQTRSAEAMFHSLMSKYDERTGDMLAKYAQQQDRLLGLLESYIPTGLPPAAAATMGGTATAALSPAMTAGHRSPMARVLHTPGGDVWSSSPRSVMSSAGGAGATLSAPATALTVPRHSRVTLLLPSAQLCSNANTQRAITASDAMGADTRDPLDCIMHDGGETFVSACAACGDGGGPTLCAVTDGATVWCTSIPAPPTTLLYCQLPLRSVGAAGDGGMSVSVILLGTQDGFIAAYARDDGATLLKPTLAKRSPVRHMAVRSAHNAADGNARLVVVYASGALRQWRIFAERTLEGGVALRCVLDLDLDVCDLLALAHAQGAPFSSVASDERGLAYDLWRVRPSDCADNAASTERLRVTLRARRAISASPAPGLQPSPPARAYEYDVDMKAWVEA